MKKSLPIVFLLLLLTACGPIKGNYHIIEKPPSIDPPPGKVGGDEDSNRHR